MSISIKKKKQKTDEDLTIIESKLKKANDLNRKVNNFKLKVKEFNYEKDQ
jgi:hypothetical protein